MIRIIFVVGILVLAGAAAQAGKLDLDLYSKPLPPADRSDQIHFRSAHWLPGDPRNLRGESSAVQILSHAGYTGFALAGLIGSIATGGVAPAIGFGVVALTQSWQFFNSTAGRR